MVPLIPGLDEGSPVDGGKSWQEVLVSFGTWVSLMGSPQEFLSGFKEMLPEGVQLLLNSVCPEDRQVEWSQPSDIFNRIRII